MLLVAGKFFGKVETTYELIFILLPAKLSKQKRIGSGRFVTNFGWNML